MNDANEHLDNILTAEYQFRLASAVRLATTFERQPLDLPMVWTHGKGKVKYSEIALDKKEADFAAFFLQRSATFILASVSYEAIRESVSYSDDTSIPFVAALHFSRFIRNSFSHRPFDPIWHIERKYRGRVLRVEDVFEFDTSELDGARFDWKHYGGPLTILGLSRFVRVAIFGQKERKSKEVPIPRRIFIQQGDLILEKVMDKELRKVIADRSEEENE